MKIAVVDDDREERALLKEYFLRLQKEIHEPMEVFEFSSGSAFLASYDYSFSLVCLDIDMPEIDGIETAKRLRKKDREITIIFVTNMAQMAIKGYEVRALDFIIKPVNYYSFAMKMQSAINVIESKRSKNIVISTSEGMQKISTDELYYAEINGHYLYYHTKKGSFVQKSSLKELEEKLEDFSFKRCNNCYLVNLKYVDCVQKDEVKVGGDWLKISRPKKKEFLQSLANFMGGVSL